MRLLLRHPFATLLKECSTTISWTSRISPVSFFYRAQTIRNCSTTTLGELHRMQQDYAHMSELCSSRAHDSQPIDPLGVFVNNEVKLGRLNVFGFDYDHTLATYTQALDAFIFNEARDWMVKQMKYPEELMNFSYSPDFVIRGLHFDVVKGYLMKVDAFHNIQLDTVHRGLTPIYAEEVLKSYRGNHLPGTMLKQQLTPGASSDSITGGKHPLMFQLMDFFMLPEFYLLASVIEFFQREKMNYQPFHLYQDVSTSIARVHKSGLLGMSIMANPEKFIHKDPHLAVFLNKLIANGRKLFVISNSSAAFIDRGLSFIIGEDWCELFDVIIARSNKPAFFRQEFTPFRLTDSHGVFKNWESVKAVHRGHFIEGGCWGELARLTGWNAQDILYFGDHVYSDLADASNLQGWTTAAVIPELEYEIKVTNSLTLQSYALRLRKLETLIDMYQHVRSIHSRALLNDWKAERQKLRDVTKTSFNTHFGSIFRSFHNPSYFSRRLTQYAVLYTSKVTNLHRYPISHVFYPKRTALPHEPFI